jgi:hypothetical protein
MAPLLQCDECRSSGFRGKQCSRKLLQIIKYLLASYFV